MGKILIFGTGKCSKEILPNLNLEQNKIVSYIDNNKLMQGRIINGVKVISPEEIQKIKFDFIIIASEYTEEIYNQLIDLGISTNRIIPYFYEMIECISEENKARLKNIFKKPNNIKKKIGLHVKNNSGSNTLALYKMMPKNISEKFDVELIYDYDILEKFENNTYDLVCTTHLGGIVNVNTKVIELWHGMGLKKIGMRTDAIDYKKYKSLVRNVEKMISYSELYSNIIKAAMPLDESKIEICGMPRNDLLFIENNYLYDIFGEHLKESQNILYMPTYRQNKSEYFDIIQSSKSFENIFGFDEFDLDEFGSFLRKNKKFIIIKLHPLEKQKINIQEYKKYEDVIGFLDDEILFERKIDLYEILNKIDILITDYSSIYVDTLLINIPTIFINNDIESYKNNRGFCLEPYEVWTPGAKVKNFGSLIKAIDNINSDKYMVQEEFVKKVCHRYLDNNSSKRVWNIIEKILLD